MTVLVKKIIIVIRFW